MGETVKEGWCILACGYEVHFEHGAPVKVSNNGKPLPAPEGLAQEITDLSGMRVMLGAWEPAEGSLEVEAPVTVARDDLDKVLRNLALVSAGVFVDRYGKPIDPDDDTDWDDEEYALDFGSALKLCGLKWGDVDKQTHVEAYRAAMHEETVRLAGHRGAFSAAQGAHSPPDAA